MSAILIYTVWLACQWDGDEPGVVLLVVRPLMPVLDHELEPHAREEEGHCAYQVKQMDPVLLDHGHTSTTCVLLQRQR